MLLKLLHSANALVPILVTLSGIVILFKLLHPQNALVSILVTPSGIIVFLQPAIIALSLVLIIALELSLLSYIVFPSSTIISPNALHPLNGLSPILDTFLGIIMLLKLLHSANALVPILVTLSGIIILLKLLHPANALVPILVTPSGISTFVTLLQFLKHASVIFVA